MWRSVTFLFSKMSCRGVPAVACGDFSPDTPSKHSEVDLAAGTWCEFSQAAAAPADGGLCKMTQEPAGAANR